MLDKLQHFSYGFELPSGSRITLQISLIMFLYQSRKKTCYTNPVMVPKTLVYLKEYQPCEINVIGKIKVTFKFHVLKTTSIL